MSTPEFEVLETIDGHPTVIRVPDADARRANLLSLSSDGHESYVRFSNALAHIEGIWVHGDIATSVFRRVEARVVPTVEYVFWKPEDKGKGPCVRVAIDFDNVIHSYTSPWSHAADIKDPPLPGAIEWLERLADEGALILLHSCRLTQWNPQADGFVAGDPADVEAAVWAWLKRYGLSDVACERISLWTWVGKPYADAYVDDKAIAFCGDYYGVDKLRGLVAYHRRQRIEALGA